MRVALILLALLFAAGSLAGPAAAQQVGAPPGLSGVDEYLETVPGVEGAERPGTDSQGQRPSGEQVERRAQEVIPAEALRELDEAGEDGEAVKRLAAVNAPRKSAPAPRSDVESLTDSGGRSPAGAVGTVVSGGGGAGFLLPFGLGALTVGLAVVAGRRRLRS
jgi:hypothetical protein